MVAVFLFSIFSFFFKLGGKQRAHPPKYITQKKIVTKKEKGDQTKPSQEWLNLKLGQPNLFLT